MKQEAFPLSASFVTGVASNVIRMKEAGRSDYYIVKVLKEVAKKHVGKEKAYLLKQAKKLENVTSTQETKNRREWNLRYA